MLEKNKRIESGLAEEIINSAAAKQEPTLAPTIVTFTPTSGLIGSEVTITGTNFLTVTAVTFNNVPATQFTILSPITIVAVVPQGATSGLIRMTNPDGTAVAIRPPFTVTNPTPSPSAPVITGFFPTSGPAGTQVTLSGANFLDATAVRFNRTDATFTVRSDNSILTAVPGNATNGKISVVNPQGTTMSANNFVVADSVPDPGLQPVITSFAPNSGPAGTLVRISGQNFINVRSVSFNRIPAPFNVNSPLLITATVPARASSGPITVFTTSGLASSPSLYFATSQEPPLPLG